MRHQSLRARDAWWNLRERLARLWLMRRMSAPFGQLRSWDHSMRSIGLLAVVTPTLVLASACSDGAGTPPPDNAAPGARFDLPSCSTGGACTFVSKSTDDVPVTRWSGEFDGHGEE